MINPTEGRGPEYEGRFSERILPPRMRLYSDVMKTVEGYAALFASRYSAKTGKPLPQGTFQMFGFNNAGVAGRNRGEGHGIPSLGVDGVMLVLAAYMSVPPSGNIPEEMRRIESYQGAHHVIRLNVDIYADGSPYVLEGDDENAKQANSYSLFVGPELMPVLIQDANFHHTDITAQSIADAPKHFLTDQDCEHILAMFNDQSVQLDVRPDDLDSYMVSLQ